MAETKKYLDEAGVEQLWKAVIARDNGIKLSYEDSNIKLTGLNGENLGTIDATPFIKDGMLEDVSIIQPNDVGGTIHYGDIDYTGDEKFIQFKWNTGADSKLDYLKVDEIGKIYTGSNSININDENSISIKEVDANLTKTKKLIPVAGGPLAELVKSVYPDGIPAEKTMEQLLMDLFCKELFAESIITSDATLVSKVDAPNINMSTSTVEVGTSVHYSVTNGASSYTATPHKISGLEYGYSATDNNTKEYTETELSAVFGPVSVAEDTSSLSISGAASGTQAGTSEASSATLTGDIIAVAGANTINASNTSATYTGTCPRLDVVYACSNLGNTDIDHVSQLKEEAVLTSESVSASALAKTFYGKYKYFIGVYSTVYGETEYNSDFIRNNAKKSDWMNGTNINLIGSDCISTEVGTKGMYIAIPEGIDDAGDNLQVIQTTALNNDASKDIAKNVRTISVKCGGDHSKNYKVFTWDYPGGTEGVEKFDITKF